MTPEHDKPTHEMGHSEALVYITKLRTVNESLIAQVEALIVPQAAFHEAQANAIIGFAQAMVEVGIDNPAIMAMANGTAKHIRALPTLPAIPGTKEGT